MTAVVLAAALFTCLAGCSDRAQDQLTGATEVDSKPGYADNVCIEWDSGVDGEHGRFRLDGLSGEQAAQVARYVDTGGDWQQIFGVHVAGSDASDIPPVAGSYENIGGSIVFTTRWPLEPGVRYRAAFRPRTAGLDESLQVTAEFEAVSRDYGPAASVTAVYPSADVLPENLLKFYLHFSRPMSQGVAFDHVRLLDDQGAVVELAFLEIAEELWSPDGLRLTLLLDPGRIKRGLRPNVEEGPALRVERSHTLQIDAAWPDARGVAIGQGMTKVFRVVPPDRDSPDPHRWKLTVPPVGTRGPLVVRFQESLDSALAVRVVWVRGPDQDAVEGQVTLDDNEQTWRLEPDTEWRAGGYHLMVGTELEDLAGNSVARPFEVSLDEKPVERPTGSVGIPFQIPANGETAPGEG